MKTLFDRRKFLQTSAAVAGAAASGFSCVELAGAAPIQVPTVDKLSMRVLVDQQHDQFLRGSTVNGVVHEGPARGAAPTRATCCITNGVSRSISNPSASRSSARCCWTSAIPRRRSSTT